MLNLWWRMQGTVATVVLGVVATPCWAMPPEAAAPVIAPAATSVVATQAGATGTPVITLSFQTSRLPAPKVVPYAATARIAQQEVSPNRAGYLGWFEGKTQLRSDRTRLDFYPIQGSGLHIAGGSRLHPGYQTVGSTIALDNRDAIRMDPRRQEGPTALSTGYDRYAPMALVGYTEKVGKRMTLGIDAGAMRGRAVAVDAFSVAGSETLGATDGRVNRMNPVMDMTLNLAF